LLTFASRIPMTTKIHNALNREMLRQHAPDLLRFPCAATPVRGGAPLIEQEAARLARHLYEKARWRLYFVSRGRLGLAHFGWLNFEFLRDGQLLNSLVDDLRSELWDRDAIRKRLADAARFDWRISANGVLAFLLKIYTMDRMVR